MIQLTKKYRIWWYKYSLNIQSDHMKEYLNESITNITDPNNFFDYYESDNLQDILDKIEDKQLNVVGDHVSYDPNI